MIASSLDSLVQDDACRISRAVFTDDGVYALEKERVFRRNWLYVGHESQIPNTGDYIAQYMGETPVIVARGEDGAIHVNVNSCSHRGLRVCRADQGNTKRFVCPYHNWSFTVSGELAAVPQDRKVDTPVDKAANGLKRVPKVATYRGLIFASFNEAIESLEAYLGDMTWYLDTFFDRFDGGVEVVGPPHKWRIKANWKLPVENQLGDVGHGPFLHGSLLKDTPASQELEDYGFNTVPRPGHGAAVRFLPADYPLDDRAWGMEGFGMLGVDESVKDYLRELQQAAEARLGDTRRHIKGLTFGVYPNFSFLWSNATIRVSHPRGPGEVEYWSWWVVPKDAPPAVKDALRNNYTLLFGPGGLLEQEDSDAWAQQYVGSAIDYMEDKPLHYGLGHGEEGPHPDLPGDVGSCYNEHYARAFYRRWLRDLKTDGEGV